MKYDVALVHAPGVYDFRNREDILFAYLGNSDSVHVSPIFEMPPIGLLSIRQHLENCGFRVEFFNIASQMLRFPEFDVEDFFRRLDAGFVGIDLHWLAHAQGALELAKLYKEVRPGGITFFGGISASYYHEELIRYPQVDYVIRGADTLLPVEMLVRAGNLPAKLKDVPNLTWKRDGEAILNDMSHRTDEFTAVVDWREVFSHDRKGVTPYNIVIPQYGCEYNCNWCGGSNYYHRKNMCLNKTIQKSPDTLKKELESIIGSETQGHTITMINYWHEYDELLEAVDDAFNEEKISRIHISIRKLPPVERFKTRGWSKKLVIELSPDSHRQDMAKACGHGHYSVDEMEEFIDSLLGHVYSFEIYFLIGIPEQTGESVWETVDYCEHLLKKYHGRRVIPYLCPMLPFLDPGSMFYDRPGHFGYRIFHKSLEDHRRALLSMNWKDRLNFETEWMSREELVQITYASIRSLTLLKKQYKVLPKGICDGIVDLIDVTGILLARIEEYQKMPDGELKRKMGDALKKQILEYNRNQFSRVRSQQRPMDLGFAKRQWFDTDEAFKGLD